MTLLLTRADVADLLSMEACIEAVEHAFRLHGEGRADPPGILSVHATDGGFHIKAGILELGRPYFAAKTNANFPANPARFGLPTIQGVLLLADAERGTPLALMDSAEITAIRTAEHTGIRVASGQWDGISNFSVLFHANDLVAIRAGHPDTALRIQANSIRTDALKLREDTPVSE